MWQLQLVLGLEVVPGDQPRAMFLKLQEMTSIQCIGTSIERKGKGWENKMEQKNYISTLSLIQVNFFNATHFQFYAYVYIRLCIMSHSVKRISSCEFQSQKLKNIWPRALPLAFSIIFFIPSCLNYLEGSFLYVEHLSCCSSGRTNVYRFSFFKLLVAERKIHGLLFQLTASSYVFSGTPLYPL